MTYEESREQLQFIMEGFCDGCEDHKCDVCQCLKAINMASVAIGKQIKMPKHRFMGYRCVCGAEVGKNQDYCDTCGQKLLPFKENSQGKQIVRRPVKK